MSDIEIDANVTVYCDRHGPHWLSVARFDRGVYSPTTIARVRELGIELPESQWVEVGVSSKKEERWAQSAPGRFARRGIDIPMARKSIVGSRAVRQTPEDSRDYKTAYVIECRRCPRAQRVNVPMREETMQILMEAIVEVTTLMRSQTYAAVTIQQLKRAVERGVPRADTPQGGLLQFLEHVAVALGYTPGSEPGPGTV